MRGEEYWATMSQMETPTVAAAYEEWGFFMSDTAETS